MIGIFAGTFMAGAILSSGWAQSKYSIKEMTPEVEAALQNRRDRFDQLKELKQKGIIGENNKGYIEVLTSVADEVPSSLEEAQSLVQSENQDRQVIYQTIARQNDLKEAVDTIEKVFAQVQRDKAQPGDKIQDEDGQWIVK